MAATQMSTTMNLLDFPQEILLMIIREHYAATDVQILKPDEIQQLVISASPVPRCLALMLTSKTVHALATPRFYENALFKLPWTNSYGADELRNKYTTISQVQHATYTFLNPAIACALGHTTWMCLPPQKSFGIEILANVNGLEFLRSAQHRIRELHGLRSLCDQKGIALTAYLTLVTHRNRNVVHPNRNEAAKLREIAKFLYTPNRKISVRSIFNMQEDTFQTLKEAVKSQLDLDLQTPGKQCFGEDVEYTCTDTEWWEDTLIENSSRERVFLWGEIPTKTVRSSRQV